MLFHQKLEYGIIVLWLLQKSHVLTTCQYTIFIWLEARLQSNIGFTLQGDLAVFTRSAIIPPKVNRFG